MTSADDRPAPALTRRHTLAGAAVLGVAVPTLAACGGSNGTSNASDGSSSASTPASASSSSSAGSASSGATKSAAGGFAQTSDIPSGGGKIFKDEKIVVTQPSSGTFKGFTDICTHQGCVVANVTSTINCDCHGSKFSITDGSVVQGPATEPLAAIEVTVSGDSISKA